MGIVLLVLLLALLLGGLGFAAHIFWLFAIIVAVVWLVGWAFGSGSSSGGRGWYRW